jgi:hypothetical protein
MTKNYKLIIIFFLGFYLNFHSLTMAQVGKNIDTFLVHTMVNPKLFSHYQFFSLFGVFKEYKWCCQTMIILSKDENDIKKITLLRNKYVTAQYHWNFYLDTLQEYIREFPTIKQDFINRNEFLRTALLAIRDYIFYYKKHFAHLSMCNIAYTKKTISTLINYYNVGYNLFEYYELNGEIGTKKSFLPHIDKVYWDSWETVLEKATPQK